MGAAAQPVGRLLKEWRQRRRLSQLDLACEADISTRHLSFLETGRAAPSREMVLHLAERLRVPLRERNNLLLAAGYAPAYSAKPLDDLGTARKAIDLVLTGHQPFPALAVDQLWTLIAANSAIPPLLAGAASSLLEPPVNVLRLTLHPEGIAPRIANLLQWRTHILDRLRHQIEATADPVLGELLAELSSYPTARGSIEPDNKRYGGVVVPLSLVTENGTLSFFSTTTVFGTPLDVTLAELAIESFFPADAATSLALGQLIQKMTER